MKEESIETAPPGEESEARKAKPIHKPCEPTREEVEAHNLTHLPFWNWCEICVRGSGQEKRHGHKNPNDGPPGVPVVSVDYSFPRDHEHEHGEEGRPLMVQEDRGTKIVFADYVQKKGEDSYAAERMAQNVERILGYNRIYI